GDRNKTQATAKAVRTNRLPSRTTMPRPRTVPRKPPQQAKGIANPVDFVAVAGVVVDAMVTAIAGNAMRTATIEVIEMENAQSGPAPRRKPAPRVPRFPNPESGAITITVLPPDISQSFSPENPSRSIVGSPRQLRFHPKLRHRIVLQRHRL